MTPDELEALTRRPGPGPHRTTHRRRRIDRRDPRRPAAAARPPALRRAQPVAGQRRGRPLPPGPARPDLLATADAGRVLPPATPIETADDALMAAGHGITDLIKLPTPRDDATRRGADRRRRPLWQKIALWRPAAVVFVYKRAADDLRRPSRWPSRGASSPAWRPGRPAVLPDARAVRPGRAGGPGPQLPAQPGGGAAGRSGLGSTASRDRRPDRGLVGSPRSPGRARNVPGRAPAGRGRTRASSQTYPPENDRADVPGGRRSRDRPWPVTDAQSPTRTERRQAADARSQRPARQSPAGAGSSPSRRSRPWSLPRGSRRPWRTGRSARPSRM